MRAFLLAVVIKVMQLGVGAQEDCASTQLLGAEAEISHGDPGLVMLQVSKEASTTVTKVTESHKKRHGYEAQSHTENGQEASAGSEQASHHHAHKSLNQDHQAKQRKEPISKLQKTSNSDSEAEQKAAPLTFGSCFSSEYGYIMYFLTLVVIGLIVGLYLQHKKNEKLAAKVRGMRARLRADKHLLLKDERKLRAEKELLREEQKRLIAAIHGRGNIFFDPERRQIVFKRTIPFEEVIRLEGIPWQTLAAYADREQAYMILSDVAEVCQILPFACFLIEGHTLRGDTIDEIDEFAHEVADARALLVKETLVCMFGVPRGNLEALGLPGALGNNQAEVLLKLVN